MSQAYDASAFAPPLDAEAFYAESLRLLADSGIPFPALGHLCGLPTTPLAQGTVEGEPPEIFAFLGSARMGETIDRFEGVKCALHGHAHRGAHASRTPSGVPVFNVAKPVLNRDLGVEYALIEV